MKRIKRLTRGKYIGGQQIAAIMRMHPYMGRGDVYAFSALGLVQIKEEEVHGDHTRPSPLRRGLICEAGLIDYIEEHILKMEKGALERDVFVQDSDTPFFSGTIDSCEVDGTGRIVHVHEMTTTTTYSLSKWGESGNKHGALRYKWMQNQWYQGITGATGGTVWLFVADTGEIRRYPVLRNEEMIKESRSIGEEFWLEHVIPKIPPELNCDSTSSWANAESSINSIYTEEKEEECDPTPEIVEAAHDYAAARDLVKSAEEAKRAAASKLKASLADSVSTKWDGGKVTWKRNNPTKKADHKAALETLAAQHKMTTEDLYNLIADHTVEKDGPRILRVTMKKKKD